MKSVGVIGAGAWGSTIAKILAENGCKVHLWSYQVLPEQLPHPEVFVTTKMSEAVEGVEGVVIALASAHFRALDELGAVQVPSLILSKGLMSGEESMFITDYLRKRALFTELAVLSGPNLAKEISEGKPAATVVASHSPELATAFQSVLSNGYFRVYTSSDVRGVELGGILKNVIAIAAGMIDGYQWGNNAKSALITRGLQEMCLIGAEFGCQPATFFGLSGLGDLMTTATSPLSRNWQFGAAFAKGERDSDDALASSEKVVEGARTSQLLQPFIVEKNLDCPIFSGIYEILFNHASAKDILSQLMERPLKPEQ